jgi:hypothetical protein
MRTISWALRIVLPALLLVGSAGAQGPASSVSPCGFVVGEGDLPPSRN